MKSEKKYILLTAALLIMFFVVGCPYKSSIAFDKPNMAINKALLGTWYTQSKPKKDSTYYLATQKTSKEYSIVKHTWVKRKKAFDKVNYTGWLSKLKNNTFLTLKTKNSYHFYKIIKSSNKQFKVDAITGNVDEKFRNQAKLKSFIQKNMHLSFFYEKTTTYYKK